MPINTLDTIIGEIYLKILSVGLGLIGGSVAKTLKKHTDWYVSGYDCSEHILNDAMECGAIDSKWKIGEKCDADLTVLCLSPSASIEFLENNAAMLKTRLGCYRCLRY